MAKKVIEPITIVDCLKCKFGTLGAYNLILCDKTITPQQNRLDVKGGCVYYKKRDSI